jgi:hypothetical protein
VVRLGSALSQLGSTFSPLGSTFSPLEILYRRLGSLDPLYDEPLSAFSIVGGVHAFSGFSFLYLLCLTLMKSDLAEKRY